MSETPGSRAPPFLVGTSVIVGTSHYISGTQIFFFSLKWGEVRAFPEVLVMSKTTQEAFVGDVVYYLIVKHVKLCPGTLAVPFHSESQGEPLRNYHPIFRLVMKL